MVFNSLQPFLRKRGIFLLGKLKVIENDLVSVYETNKGEKVVYGLELHKALEVKSPYREWSARRFDDIEAVENREYQAVEISTPSGQTKKNHIIKLNTAKEMAMLERNDKGKQVRRYFIKIEEKYKEAVTKGRLKQSYWQQTRLAAKESRLLETDSIKEFVAYAKSQGSQHADRYYCSFTKMANKAAGITSGRDGASIQQLNSLALIEHIITEVIQGSIRQEKPYKEIYLDCKDQIQRFVEVAYLARG